MIMDLDFFFVNYYVIEMESFYNLIVMYMKKNYVVFFLNYDYYLVIS